MGVATNHPDLRGQVLPGVNLYRPGTPQGDIYGHGTQVAGVIAALAGNGEGIVGVAPRSKILPIQIGEGRAINGNLAPAAIDWASSHGADVINMSFGGSPLVGEAVYQTFGLGAAIQAAVDRAWARGVVVVAAAGNGKYPLCSPPASLKNVLCVGAVDEQRTPAFYSQSDALGRSTYLVAPGGSANETPGRRGIWTTTVVTNGDTTISVGGSGQKPQPYVQTYGTSFAAPFVSGVAALLAARGYSNKEIVRRLLSTATDLGQPGHDPLYGHGEVDAARALRGR